MKVVFVMVTCHINTSKLLKQAGLGGQRKPVKKACIRQLEQSKFVGLATTQEQTFPWQGSAAKTVQSLKLLFVASNVLLKCQTLKTNWSIAWATTVLETVPSWSHLV